MAEKSLDKQTKQIDQMQVKKGNEMEVMQRAQNQFLNLQAERKNNLAQQRMMMSNDQNQNALMMQAAQIGTMGGGRDQGIPQTVDPRTQAVMNKYGMGKPRFQRSQQHSQQVTKQNVTIHNTTNNNTTNNVTTMGGPVGGRALSVGKMNDDSTQKFKVWLMNSYAKQQQQAIIRNREYEKREESLTRNSNKMMRKLEGLGKTVAKVMDPRRIGQTMIDPFRMLFMFMGFHLFLGNFKKILKFVDKIGSYMEGIGGTFGITVENGHVVVDKEGIAEGVDKKLGWLGASIVRAFGGRPENRETVSTVLERVLIGDDQHYGLWNKFKDYFEDFKEERVEALKELEFPNLSTYIDKNDIIGGIKELMKYLGDVVTIGLNGAKGLGIIAREHDTADYNNNKYKFVNEDDDDYTDSVNYKVKQWSSSEREALYTDKEYEQQLLKQLNVQLALKKKRSYEFTNNLITDGLKGWQKKTAVEQYLGEGKNEELRKMGLNVDYDSDDTVVNSDGSATLSVTDEIGNIFNLQFSPDGNLNLSSAPEYQGNINSSKKFLFFGKRTDDSLGNIFTSKFARGEIALGTKELSYADIQDAGKNTLKKTDLSLYRQTAELAKLIENGQMGSFDDRGFAMGMERMQKYLATLKQDNFVPVDKNYLQLLGVSDKRFEEFIANGEAKYIFFFTVKRKINPGDLDLYFHKGTPEAEAAKKYINSYLRQNVPGLSDYTSWTDWFSTNSSYQASPMWQAIQTYLSENFSFSTDYIGDIVSEDRLEEMRREDRKKRLPEDKPYNVRLLIYSENLTESKVLEGFSRAEKEKAIYEKVPAIKISLFKTLYQAKTSRNLLAVGDGLSENLTDVQVAKNRQQGVANPEDYAHDITNSFHNDYRLDGKKGSYNSRTEQGYSFFGASYTGNDTTAAINAEGRAQARLIKQNNSDINDKIRRELAKDDKSKMDTFKKAFENMRDIDYMSGEAYNNIAKDNDDDSINTKIAYVKATLKSALKAEGLKVDEDTLNAIVGVMLLESGLDPGIRERGNSGKGEGIHQWTTAANQERILGYINSRREKAGLPKLNSILEADINEQISALAWDIAGANKKPGETFGPEALKKTLAAGTLREKVAAWTDTYGRGADSTAWAKKNPNLPAYQEIKKGYENLSKEQLYDKNGKLKSEYAAWKNNNRSRNQVLTERLKFAEQVRENPITHSTLANLVAGGAEKLGNGINAGIDFWTDSKPKLLEKFNAFLATEEGQKFEGTFEDWIEWGKKKAKEKRDKVYGFFTTTHESATKVARAEHGSYQAYLNNPGSLPAGLSEGAWQEMVKAQTGFYPNALGSSYMNIHTQLTPDEITLNSSRVKENLDNLEGIEKVYYSKKIAEQEKVQKEKEEKEKREKENNATLKETKKAVKVIQNSMPLLGAKGSEEKTKTGSTK